VKAASPHPLTGLAKSVIEAALEAELAVHLDHCGHDSDCETWGGLGTRRRRNSRNGTRPKTVRTTVGAVEIDAPRDRWGTFEPVTVGKWQREGPGIDRVLLPLAAKGTPPEVAHRLLSMVYPGEVSSSTLHRIAVSVHERLREWHEKDLGPCFESLRLQLTVLRAEDGRALGPPVATVLGTPSSEPGRPQPLELLGLHAVPPARFDEPWGDVLGDLRRRGVMGVREVVGDGSASLCDAVTGLWADAAVS
jgi:transposase-like protein